MYTIDEIKQMKYANEAPFYGAASMSIWLPQLALRALATKFSANEICDTFIDIEEDEVGKHEYILTDVTDSEEAWNDPIYGEKSPMISEGFNKFVGKLTKI